MQIEVTREMLSGMFLPRPEDGHKGTFGHALLIAGKYGMAGASILAAQACMRTGVGKLTVHIPERNNDIIQMSVPEAIVEHDKTSQRCFACATDIDVYQAVGIGPGLGTNDETAQALYAQLRLIASKSQVNATSAAFGLVLDADAINLFSMHPEWVSVIPGKTILTPHPGEYQRMVDAGITFEDFILVLKGHPTHIYWQGEECICPWGNNGMGTAGSGDVLTGIILGLLAQGYEPVDAAILGVSLHAISGDIAAGELGCHSVIASDLIRYLPRAFLL